jgi:hypothetical protein
MLLSPEELAVEMGELRAACAQRGRDAKALDITVFEYDPGSDRAASQDLLDRYANAGADRMVIIQGLGDHMGSTEWAAWTTDGFEAELERVAGRFL